MYIFIILLAIFVLYYNYKTVDDHPIYADIDIGSICNKYHSEQDDDHYLPQQSQQYQQSRQSQHSRQSQQPYDQSNQQYGMDWRDGTCLDSKYVDNDTDITDADHSDVKLLYRGESDDPIVGDDKIVFAALESGKKNQIAMTNRALWNKNTFLPYYEEELRAHADSIWWDDETLESEF